MKNSRNPLIDILHDFDEQKNGICLLSVQTGIGKTFSVAQNISEHYKTLHADASGKKVKYIYAVHLTSLRNEFCAELRKELPEDIYVSFLKSFDDSFLDMICMLLQDLKISSKNIDNQLMNENIKEKVINKAVHDLVVRFPSNVKAIGEKDVFADFKSSLINIIRAYISLVRSKNREFYTPQDKKVREEEYKYQKSVFTKSLNSIFLSHYTNYVNGKVPKFDKEAFLNDFFENKDQPIFKWVLAMFPSYIASCADVIVMTHDKLYKPINDICFKGSRITDTEYFQNGNYTVYYDEANKGFSKLLSNQIESYAKGEKSQRSIVQKIINIIKNLEDNVDGGYSSEIKRLFNKKISTKDKTSSVLSQLKSNQEDLRKVVKHPLWTIRFFDKTQTEVFETSSLQTVVLHQAPEKYILKEDEICQHYELVEKAKYKGDKSDILTIYDYINAQGRFIESFCYYFFYNIIPHYAKLHPKFTLGYDSKKFSFIEAIFHGFVDDREIFEIVHSLLSNLNVCDVKYNVNNLDPLEGTILNFIKCQKAQKAGIEGKNAISFKESYPQTIEILKNINDENVFIYLRQMNIAPEDWLGNLALKSRVCVISATNSDPSIYNYDHRWLSKRVPYYNPPKELIEDLEKYKKECRKYSDKIKKTVVKISGNIKELENYPEIKETVKCFLRDKKSIFLGNEKEIVNKYKYFQGIYIKEAILIYNFLTCKESMPVHLSVYTRSVDFSEIVDDFNYKLSAKLLDELFIRICKALGKDESQYVVPNKYNYHFMVLRNVSNDSELNLLERVEELKQRVNDGVRTYCYTTYDAAAVGLNLLLPVSSHYQDSLVALNDFAFGRDNFNINSIYLDKPTNSIPELKLSSNEVENLTTKMNRAFFVTRLCNVTGEIEPSKMYEYSTVSKPRTSGLTSSYHYIIERLIQAIGRIDRTSVALDSLFIYIDENITIPEYIFNEWNQDDFSKLFKLVKEKIINKDAQDLSLENYCRRLENQLNRGAQTMKSILNPGSYDNRKIEAAEKLSNFINKNITIDSDTPFIDGTIPAEYSTLYINVEEIERHKLNLETIRYKCNESSRGAKFKIMTDGEEGLKLFENSFEKNTQECSEDILEKFKGDFQMNWNLHPNYFLNPICNPKIAGNFGEAIVKYFFEENGYNLNKTFDFKGFSKGKEPSEIELERLKLQTYEKFDFYLSENKQTIPVEVKNYNYKVHSLEDTEAFYEKYFQRMEDFDLIKMILINTSTEGSDEGASLIKVDDLYPDCQILVVSGILKNGSWNKGIARKIENFIK